MSVSTNKTCHPSMKRSLRRTLSSRSTSPSLLHLSSESTFAGSTARARALQRPASDFSNTEYRLRLPAPTTPSGCSDAEVGAGTQLDVLSRRTGERRFDVSVYMPLVGLKRSFQVVW